MLQYVASFGPIVLAVGAMLIAGSTLNRKPPSWLLRYRIWLKSASSFQNALCKGVCFFILYCVIAALMLPAAQMHLLVPYLHGPLYWILAGAVMAVFMFFASILYEKTYDEPEDWLLWDKHETNRR